MATPSGRTFRPGGVVRAGLRLVLLVGIGFVSGLLIGVLTEEPELLAGHLRGESEAIVLTPTVESAAEVAALEGAPAESETPATRAGSNDSVVRPTAEPDAPAQTDRRVAMAPRAEEGATASLPRVSASRPDEGLRDWSIQVGAFSDEKAAQRLAEGLRGKGYPVDVLAAGGAAQRWRVRVQPIRGEERAGAISKRLKRDEGLPTWPQPMEDRSAQ